MPFMSAQRDARGNLELRPPDPEYERFLLPRMPKAWHEIQWKKLVRISYFAKWLDIKKIGMVDRVNEIAVIRAAINAPIGPDPQFMAWMDIIAERPCCASLLDDWQPVIEHGYLDAPFTEEYLPPVFEEALEYTAFGIDQFKRRTDSDGAALAILPVAPYMGTRGDPQFDRLNAIAEVSGIPIINNYDYIFRQGHDVWVARWSHNGHWNATGHQWVAEAVLEWLKANQDVCE